MQPTPAPEPAPSEWREISAPLAAEMVGDDADNRIVFVHGFTQTANTWKPIANHFRERGHQCVLVDLPGHGGSALVRADLRRTADMVAAIGGRATYVGYSLGGRVCLHLALMYPDLVQRLVLLGAHPGIDDDGERAARRESDTHLADHIIEVGLPQFLAEWSSQPLFGGLVLDDAELADRLRNTPEGLVNSLSMAGTGIQTSLWPRLRELAMPVLAMAGEHDTKFIGVAEQIADAVIDGTFLPLGGAAHAAHLQSPGAVIAAIETFVPAPQSAPQT